jgi:hypothetical protein
VPILDQLNAEMPAGESREAFATYMAAEIAKWRGVIQTTGVKIDRDTRS